MSSKVIEGILSEGGFVQTNGTSFAHWLAERDERLRDEVRREVSLNPVILRDGDLWLWRCDVCRHPESAEATFARAAARFLGHLEGFHERLSKEPGDG